MDNWVYLAGAVAICYYLHKNKKVPAKTVVEPQKTIEITEKSGEAAVGQYFA